MNSHFHVLAAAFFFAIWAQETGAEEVPFSGESAVRFASVEEGTKILTADDDFSRSLSRFDLQSRLQTDGDVTIEDWKKFAAAEVRPWSPEQMATVKESLERLAKRLATYRLPLPEKVLLIHTSGREEGDAAYTRGPAIILPDKVLGYPPSQLDRLMLHELFHVLSRHDSAARRKLYRIIGFETCDPITMPASLADRKITNPDAPLPDCYVELMDAGRKILGVPVLYSSVKQYDAAQGGSFFRYLTFRLLVVERKDGRLEPVLLDKEAVVVDPKKIPEFFEKIGKNTNYIIHPDEILADNFIHLVMEDQDLPSPQIVTEMAAVFAR